jgi:predicted transcriptional regulator
MAALTQEELLRIVDEQNSVDSREVAQANNWDHDQLIGTMNSLISKEMLVGTKKESNVLQTTPEGDDVIARGSPEFRVYNAVIAEPKTKDALSVSFRISSFLINHTCSLHKVRLN